MNERFQFDFSERTEAARLAALLMRDIEERGLQPGDRYLNGPEVAEKYGVTVITANRALQSLAERAVVERRQRAGTFISKQYSPGGESSELQRVHLLMPATYFRAARTTIEQAIAGIHAELPDCHIQLTFVPVSGEVAFARKLVQQAKSNGATEGAVLYVSSGELQQFFRESGFPAVAFGSVFPEAEQLPWVDRDQRQIGELLSQFLLQEGHRNLAVLMRERWGFGDNLLLDGLQGVLAAANAGATFRVRNLPTVPEAGLAMLRLLLQGEEAPTALICRSERLALLAAQVAAEFKLKMPRQLRIVVAEAVPQFPCVEPTVSQEEQGAFVGRMLKQMASGKRPDPDHLRVPVRFRNLLSS